jgi:hypothetical protein
MYHGFMGPIPFLHWFIKTDGEGSYSLSALEMFVQLTVLLIAAIGVRKHLTHR